ncbi:MAG: bifunctional 3,4-dihydroxy-2-butanone-4-phosphate synthase/GTP cyclohydrolase II [Bacteroidales bacterium]|nr:bifunctional 3,4-dihydroxy-2-butanone-4-phosphate synthase/GTP cyclohydrolase II [Bacteroidales bacterium]
MNDYKLNTIEEAINDIRDGKFLIVVDDEDRENEGDFIIAAEKVTEEKVNFMVTYGRGVLCAPITEERCKELDLEMQVNNNTSIYETPFTVTVDMLKNGCTTGVSMHDRAATIRALADPKTKPEDLGRPGHINPLRARSRGVLRRAGHTEAAVDLARLAGLSPAGALIEIINEDGTMARLPQLIEVGKRFGIKIVTIKDLIAYRLQAESIVEKGIEVDMPTEYGHFRLIPFKQLSNGLEHVALIKGTWEKEEPVLVRVHSSCMTGDIFSSCRCECGEQLHKAMQEIEKAGKGVVVYMNQEGRGIGLMNKIKAYKLQEQGLDTVEANLHLGFNADERDYGVGAEILRELGIHKMRLMTNNPVKRIGLEAYGLQIVENVPIEITPNQYNERYLKTKKDRMGHTLRNIK